MNMPRKISTSRISPSTIHQAAARLRYASRQSTAMNNNEPTNLGRNSGHHRTSLAIHDHCKEHDLLSEQCHQNHQPANRDCLYVSNQQLPELLNVVHKYEVLYDWAHEHHFDDSHIANVWNEIGQQTGYGAKQCRLSWHDFCKKFLIFYNRKTLISGEKHELHEEMRPFLPFIYKDLTTMEIEEDLVHEMEKQDPLIQEALCKEPYITLINSVYEHRVLYDMNHPMYYDDKYTLGVWRQIRERVHCAEESCKIMWKKTHTRFCNFYEHVTLVTGEKHVLHDLLVRFVPFLPQILECKRNNTIPCLTTQNQDGEVNIIQNDQNDIGMFENNSIVTDTDVQDSTISPEEFVKTETSIVFPQETEISKENTEKDANINNVKIPSVSTTSISKYTTNNNFKLNIASNFEEFVKALGNPSKTDVDHDREYRARKTAKKITALQNLGRVIVVKRPASTSTSTTDDFQENLEKKDRKPPKSDVQRNREYRARKRALKLAAQEEARNKLAEQNQLATDSLQLITVESPEEYDQDRTGRLQKLDVAIEQQSSVETLATKATCSNIRLWELGNERLKVLLEIVYKHKVLYDKSHERHFDAAHVSNVWMEIGRQTGYGAKRCRLNWQIICKRFLTFYNRRTLISGDKHDLHDEMMPFLNWIYKDLTAMKIEEDLRIEKKIQEAGNVSCGEPYITLINSIYQHEELYDENHPMYNDDNHTLNIWKQIDEQINCTVCSCKAMWMKSRSNFFKVYTNVTAVTGKKHVLHDLLVRFLPYLPNFQDFLKNEMIVKEAPVSVTSTSNFTTDDFQTNLLNYFNNEEFVKTETCIIFPDVVVKKENFAWETN